MKPLRQLSLARLCLALCLLALPAAAAAPAYGEKDWLPLDPAHLAMKEPVVERDADAEVIFWEVRVSYESGGYDLGTNLSHYVRIKIFTERGRESQSRVDILAPKAFGRETKIKDIAARTIKPDGTVVELKKEDIFERDVFKANGIKVKAKTFALPAVEPGSIVEYRWREVRNGISGFERFDFARDIPVQSVRYYIKPAGEALVDAEGNLVGLNARTFHGETAPFKKEKDGSYSTSMSNVPAFREEPRMPPEYAIRPWMLAYYAPARKITPEQFWKSFGKSLYDEHKSSMKVNDEIKRAAAEATEGAATDEEKLDRLFNFVRAKVRNVHDAASGFTPEQVEKMKANKSPADTLKRGVGDWHDIDMLFAALATAAGFDARVAKLSDRGDAFFDPSFPSEYFMRTENIAVRVGDNWRFYDPGSTYITRGMLRWREEGQPALVSDPKGALFVTTPVSGPEKSVERRTGKFRLAEDGTLEGQVRIEYTGHLAYDMKERNEDDSPAEREEALRERFKSRLGEVELADIQVENATDPDKPFAYSLRVRVPGYAQRTGKRLFLQPAFFQRGLGPLFPTSARRHDVYFYYPWSEEDAVEITLPEGFALDNPDAPAPFGAGPISRYEPRAAVTKDGRTIVYSRKFFFNPLNETGLVVFPTTSYPNLKQYFDQVHKQDGHTISLKQAAASAASSN
ncbi:MAG: DUF3857 and transglutaminase domain-containing protein [Acidobacteriota bacterium]|nr:DUF3857 and transglutaminase domain-containing protein [Acidobacteriota bacterium]